MNGKSLFYAGVAAYILAVTVGVVVRDAWREREREATNGRLTALFGDADIAGKLERRRIEVADRLRAAGLGAPAQGEGE